MKFKDTKYLVPKHGMMYLGDYPSCYAPEYCSLEYVSDDECWLSGPDSDVDSSDDGVSGSIIVLLKWSL